MSPNSFKRLVRFVPKSDPSSILVGQPEDDDLDVGKALYEGKEVSVIVFDGKTVLNPGKPTQQTAIVERVLSPLSINEVGTIRCIGLNVGRPESLALAHISHADEVGMEYPKLPTVFMKPDTALADPWPAPTVIPKITQLDDCGDYEAELCVVIGKQAKNVSEAEALDYVLGYTASNDVSSRSSQFAQTQWSYSKGFDSACPIGPTLVSASLIPDPAKLFVRGLHNGKLMQQSGVDDLIFTVPQLVSFLSQGTTLRPGTIILTGTPAGVGIGKKPKVTLKHGDEFAVEILPYIGTLINKMENE